MSARVGRRSNGTSGKLVVAAWWRRLSSNVPIRGPFGPQQLEVDIGGRRARTVGEALGLGQQDPVLVDHRLAVPRQVGRRLPRPGRGVQVRGEAARRRRPAQQPSILGPTDGDRATGQVGQHRRAGQRRLGARRDRHPHVLADLDVHDETGDVVGAEQQVGPERDRFAAETIDRDDLPLAGPVRELAPLVELAVGRQVGLGHHAEQAAPVDDDGRVVHAVAKAQGGAHDEHRAELGRGRARAFAPPPRPRRGAGLGAPRPRSNSPTGPARGTRRVRRHRRHIAARARAPARRCQPDRRST